MSMPDADIKIMCVDDFSTMRRIIKTLLKQIGYQNILEAEDGAQALHLLKSEAVDFIISDWNMPKMTGLELLRAVRSEDQLKAIPFLMITADSEKEKVIEAIRAGVSNYIVKPFNADILKGKMEEIFAHRIS